MTDKGFVIATERDSAEVEITCFTGCHECAAKSLCIGNKHNKGRLSVKNPLHAQPGDHVKIQIPEEKYSRALILLFGWLLSAIFLGIGAGYVSSMIFSLPVSLTSLIGLVCGLAIGGSVLARIFRHKNKDQLYPVIIDIIKKGENYGPA